MSILQSELKWYKSKEMSDQGTNGGLMSPTVSVSNVKNNIWPDVTNAERIAGSTKYRKVHVKVDNSENLPLQDAKFYLDRYTAGADSVMLFAGTHSDIQSDLSGSERVYGAGQLNADVSSGATVISVLTEGVAYNMFQAGDVIRVSNKTDINDATGTEEFVTIGSAPSYVGDVATITLSPALDNSYVGTETRVSSVISAGVIESGYSGLSAVSAGGAMDDTNFPISVPNISGVYDDWTLTFTSGTAFNIIGARTGAVGSGSILTTAAPNNPDYSLPFFSIPSGMWGGTWQAGDSVSFHTDPASFPVWYKRVVPAGATSLTGNEAVAVLDGEST